MPYFLPQPTLQPHCTSPPPRSPPSANSSPPSLSLSRGPPLHFIAVHSVTRVWFIWYSWGDKLDSYIHSTLLAFRFAWALAWMESAACGEDCCVKVAVHIRPLIGDERLQGCKDCVTAIPGKPQVPLTVPLSLSPSLPPPPSLREMWSWVRFSLAAAWDLDLIICLVIEKSPFSREFCWVLCMFDWDDCTELEWSTGNQRRGSIFYF